MIPIFEPLITEEDKKNVIHCLETNWFSSQGNFILEFEKKLALIHNLSDCAVTSNCTTALHLALLALDIGPGDEVICPDLTFIAPANMIMLTGAKPVLCDVDPKTLCIRSDLIENLITKQTKALMVVHAFGHMSYMPDIMKIAQKYNIKIIEDVAEAPGAKIDGHLAGTFGDIGCFSFFANKIFTTGEGGACISNNNELIEKIKILRDHGMSKERRYYHPILGFNYRMTNMQAGLGLGQINRFNIILEKRNKIDKLYKDLFKKFSNLHYRSYANWCKGVFWLSTISVSPNLNRDKLIQFLKEKGIEARQMVNPVHTAPPFSHLPNKHLINSKKISLSSLHLPSSLSLTKENVIFICFMIKNY